MSKLLNANLGTPQRALYIFLLGAALVLPVAHAQIYSTTDTALNTGIPASTVYYAPGTNGTAAPVDLSANATKQLWLLYNDPWGLSSGKGTMTQTYNGHGQIVTAISMTGLPKSGVDAYPFVLYGCDPWMDCFQNQPPQFPKKLATMSTLMADIKYAMTGTITGSDIDLLFDEWVCNSSTPSDSSQCLEVEILPYYSFIYFGGGTYIKTMQVPITLNGVSEYMDFDEYVGSNNVTFYPHKKPGIPSGELKINLLEFLTSAVSVYGNSSYQYVAGIELGTEFGAGSTQNYTLTLSKFGIMQVMAKKQPADTSSDE